MTNDELKPEPQTICCFSFFCVINTVFTVRIRSPDWSMLFTSWHITTRAIFRSSSNIIINSLNFSKMNKKESNQKDEFWTNRYNIYRFPHGNRCRWGDFEGNQSFPLQHSWQRLFHSYAARRRCLYLSFVSRICINERSAIFWIRFCSV